MNHRALGAFTISLVLASAHAHAQDGEDAESEPDPKVSASIGASAGSEAPAEVEGKARTSTTAATSDGKAAPTEPSNAEARPERAPIYGKRGDWFIAPYGYARFDAIHDSTQSFDDGIQPNLIARAGTYRGDHRRATFTARDSRLGVFVGAPPFEGIKSSGQIELDFYGLSISDAKKHDQVVLAPLRLRHAYLKIETAIDVIAGQYYDVFGWGSYFYPATVAYLGVPGEIYHRNPQLRLEKKIELGQLEIDVAVAAVRPGQRDAGGIPDGQAGLKVGYHGWSGAATPGFGRASLQPVSLGVSGMYRRFEVPAFRGEPGSEAMKTFGYGIAAQALLPIIPVSSIDDKSNGLTVTGEVSLGTGIADMYTGMDGGSRFPLLPNPTMAAPALIYPQNVDPGLVTIDRAFEVKSIDWKAFVAGVQYYLPLKQGRVWVSGIYSRAWSDNIKELTPAASWGGIFTKMEYIDANVGMDITPAIAVGLSFQTVKQTFADVSAPTPNFGTIAVPGTLGVPAGQQGTGGVAATARNNRGQLSMALFF